MSRVITTSFSSPVGPGKKAIGTLDAKPPPALDVEPPLLFLLVDLLLFELPPPLALASALPVCSSGLFSGASCGLITSEGPFVKSIS